MVDLKERGIKRDKSMEEGGQRMEGTKKKQVCYLGIFKVTTTWPSGNTSPGVSSYSTTLFHIHALS